MPRGRKYLSPKEAKKKSIDKILEILSTSIEGKRFTDIKILSGFHQSTVSSILDELIASNMVEKDRDKRLYRIMREGSQFYEIRRLVEVIENSSGMIIGSEGAASLDQVEDVVLKTTTAYAFPALNASFLGELKRSLHKLYLTEYIKRLVKLHIVDHRYLVGELALDGLVDLLGELLPSGEQVVAFKIDQTLLKEIMNCEYLEKIIH